jgi:prepilin-type N-terminal cleavage/methylation domain-containing protein
MAGTRSTPVVANHAFTLVEVLCSAAILGILCLALFYGLSQGFSMTQTEREALRATQIALTRMEGLRLEAWSSNQLFNPIFVPHSFTESFYPLGLNGSSSTGPVYSGTMTVKTCPFTGESPVPSYNSNMALVTVVVNWQDIEHGRTNTFTRTNYTFVAKYGIQNYVYAQ